MANCIPRCINRLDIKPYRSLNNILIIMTRTLYSLSLSIVLSLLIACGGGESSQNSSASKKSTPAKKEEAPQVASGEELLAGEKVYQTYCVACHMEDGNGVPNMNPPLGKTEWVNGDKTRLINTVLNGLNGPIEVNGEPYNNVMVPHNFLSDEDIAAVLTYVRASFGNTSGPITADEVADVRSGG